MSSWDDRYWTSSDGLKLHYRDYPGRADRPPVLCLHGLTRNCRDYERLAERLSGDWRVLTPDFRGRGLSQYDPEPNRYVAPTYAADIIRLLDELGIGEAVFIGTSLGGLTTMIVAAFAPHRISGALLNDVGPELDPAGLARIGGYVGQPLLFTDWNDAADQLSAKYGEVHPTYGREEWLRYALRVGRESDRGIELDYDMAIAEPFRQMDSATAAASNAWPLFQALAGRPVTILRGETSDLLSPEIAQRMRDSVPGAGLVTVPNVGHAPDFEEPESIAAVDRLLQRVLDR